MIYFKSQNPTAQEYLLIRQLVGWGDMPLEVIESSIAKNLYAVCAYNNQDEIVGTARVVGDGGLCFYIQDVMVHPLYQKNKIGTQMLEHIMIYLKENACFNSYVGLMAASGMEHFYARFGFNIRPNEHMGPGMIQFWGREGELTES
jgi:GNAT superfamily N-acetyltransferase